MKKQHFFRLFSLLLCVLCFMTACSKGDQPAAATPTAQPATEAAPAEKPAASGSYQDGAMFQFGITPAKAGGNLYGYMNIHGDWVIEPAYRSATSFSSNGLAFVMIGREQWRCIDLQGNFVSDHVFCSVSSAFAPCGIAKVFIEREEGREQAYFFKGENGFELKYGSDFAKNAGLADFTDEGYATVNVVNYGSGIINSDFEWVIEPREGLWLNSEALQQGLCAADDQVNRISGFVDASGSWVYQMDHYYGSDFYLHTAYSSNGLVYLQEDRSVRDTTGNLLFYMDHSYGDSRGRFGEGGLITFSKAGKNGGSYSLYNYCTEKGELFASLQISDDYHWLETPTMHADRMLSMKVCIEDANGNITGIQPDGTVGGKRPVVINRAGKFVFAPGEPMSNFYTDGYAWIEIDDDDGIIAILDVNGNRVFQSSADKPVYSIAAEH